MFICFLSLFVSIQVSDAYGKVLMHYSELHSFNCAPDIIRVIGWGGTRHAGNVVCMKRINLFKIVVVKREGRRTLWRWRNERTVKVTVDLTEIDWKDVCVCVRACVRACVCVGDEWWGVLNTDWSLMSVTCTEFLCSWATFVFLRTLCFMCIVNCCALYWAV